MPRAKPARETPETKMAAKLASSGVTKSAAADCKITLAKPSDLAKLHLPQEFAIRLPYFNPRGTVTGFARYRYLSLDILQPDGKPLRYVQPAGTVNEIYLPPLVDWPSICLDPTVSIVITEGELKAACACLNGYNTIGLGGVWCWRSASNGHAIIPSLRDWLVWPEREVRILFDSDAETNPNVMQAQHELALALTELGAKPYICKLPALTESDMAASGAPVPAKTGLDDFIVAKGAPAVQSVLDAAEDFAGAAELYRLNKEVLFVKNPGFILVRDTGQKMGHADFTNLAYADRHYMREMMMPDGSTRLKRIDTAKEWIKWPERSRVETIVYEPGKPNIVNNCYNMWRGWGCEPVAGDVTPWVELLDYLFFEEPESRQWFEQWCAYPIQHPGTKLYTAAVLWGIRTGTGKSLIGYTLKQIYGDNFTEIEEEHLTAPHNEWCENKQFVLGDDITGREQRDYANKLKRMITRQTMRLNLKYVKSYDIRDCINFYFTSNQPDAFFLEDNDRRFFVHEVTQKPHTAEFYKRYDSWYKSKEGAQALFYHLLHLDCSGFNPTAQARVTDAKRAMINDTRSDISYWVHQLINDPASVLKRNNTPLNYTFWRTEDLLKIYDPMCTSRSTVVTLNRELKRCGVPQVARGKTCRTYAGQRKLWCLRNWDNEHKYIKADDAGRLYDFERATAGEPVPMPEPIGNDKKARKKAEKAMGMGGATTIQRIW